MGCPAALAVFGALGQCRQEALSRPYGLLGFRAGWSKHYGLNRWGVYPGEVFNRLGLIIFCSRRR